MSSRDWHFRIKGHSKIELYIADMTAGQFKKNELVIDAVVRNLEINAMCDVFHGYNLSFRTFSLDT